MKQLSLLLLILTLAVTPAFAQSKSKEVQRLERQRREALKEVEKTDKKLKQVSNDRYKKQKEANLLKKQAAQRQKAVNLLDEEIKVLDKDIDSLSTQATHLRNEEERRRKAYEESVIAMRRRAKSTDRMLFLLSAADFDEGVRRMRFLGQFAQAHRDAAKQLKETRTKVEENKHAIEGNKTQKATLMETREREKQKLLTQQKQRTGEVSKLRGEEKKLQQQKRQQQQRANALNKKIEQRIAYEIAEAERKAREAAAKAAQQKGGSTTEQRKAVTKGGYAMTAEERQLGGSFERNKGNLLMPVSGSYTIVASFGVQQHKTESKVQTNKSGIDIAVPAGTRARAVFEGTVSSIFMVEGYHSSVIVRHGNYLTVYANLQSVSVRTGQKVKTGQTIGTIATGDDGRGLLHFQLWHERTKQNPMQWIR